MPRPKNKLREICITDHGNHYSVAIHEEGKARKYLVFMTGYHMLHASMIKKYFDALWYLFTHKT
jgi:hypothetical protein